MIEYKQGDILQEDAEALINTVNCVGVMGRGIALQFKNAFPENYKAYVNACKNDEVQPGKMFIFDTGNLNNPRYIINFPTKRHWRGMSRMDDIEAGLKALVEVILQYKIGTIAIPALGSGLGGLDWFKVKILIEEYMRPLADIRIIIYEPVGVTERLQQSSKVPAMTPGRAALIGLINQYLKGLLDPFVSLLEVHKLMYFMQAAGEPLKLNYKKALYGPYAENLRHVLNAIEGHFISGYADGGDNPDKQLKIMPGAIEEANEFLQEHSHTLERFNKVTELVDGFESPFGLELLATVHWVMTQDRLKSLDDVISSTYAWNDRKQRFSSRQISLAVDVLSRNGWVQAFTIEA